MLFGVQVWWVSAILSVAAVLARRMCHLINCARYGAIGRGCSVGWPGRWRGGGWFADSSGRFTAASAAWYKPTNSVNSIAAAT
jgi:hypothetical protein